MIPMGHQVELKISEILAHGAELTDGDDQVLLPRKLVDAEMQVGNILTVFIYTDSEDRRVATTKVPKAQVGDFACLQVIDTSEHGAFLDWGLEKDLFLPFNLQHRKVRQGESVVAAVFVDPRTQRVTASTRLGPFLSYDLSALKEGQEVNCVVYGENDLGIQVIVEDDFGGLVYRSDTFIETQIGQRVTGKIEKIRTDNKLDISLHSSGREKVTGAAEVILKALESEGGYLNLHDKSDKDEIYQRLQISKKAFKAGVGQLYKTRRITLEAEGIRKS